MVQARVEALLALVLVQQASLTYTPKAENSLSSKEFRKLIKNLRSFWSVWHSATPKERKVMYEEGYKILKGCVEPLTCKYCVVACVLLLSVCWLLSGMTDVVTVATCMQSPPRRRAADAHSHGRGQHGHQPGRYAG